MAEIPKSSEHRVSRGGEGVPRYVGEVEQKRLAIKALEEGHDEGLERARRALNQKEE